MRIADIHRAKQPRSLSQVMDQIVDPIVLGRLARLGVADNNGRSKDGDGQRSLELLDLDLGKVFGLFVKIAKFRFVFEFGLEDPALAFARERQAQSIRAAYMQVF